MQRSVAIITTLILALAALSTTSCRNRGSQQSTLCKSDADCEKALPFCTPDGVCVECYETTQCDCSQQCLDSACQPLGANQPNQSLNAHGNWIGTPGQQNYQFSAKCTDNGDCGIGQICNPLTGGCIMASQFTEDCNPDDANDCPSGPNGESLVCEPTSQKCMPAPSCVETYNCCGQENLICDSSAQVCRAIADECTPPTDLVTTCPLEPKNQDSCLPGYFCSLVGTCVQCTCDEDCGSGDSSGLKCHLPTHTCKSADYCDTAADCNQPTESCDRQANLCKPSCTVANEVEDCGLNFFCDPSDKVCRSKAELPCTADAYAPNANAAEAAAIGLPALGSTTHLTDLSVCNNDNDWFTITMEAGQRLIATLSSTDPTMSAQSFILSADGESVLAEGLLNNLGGSQLLDFTANASGQYFLKIDPTGDSEGWYSISFTLSQGELCSDPFEADSPNESSSAATLLLDETSSTAPDSCTANFSGVAPQSFVRCDSNTVKICLGDVDYYEVVLAHSSRFEVTIKDYLGDLDLLVYGPFEDGEAFDSSRIAGGQDLPANLVKTVETVARNASRYFMKVAGGPGAESSYTIETRVTHITDCTEDVYDAANQNDSPATASELIIPVGTTNFSDLKLCVGDVDWFELGIDDGSGNLNPLPAGQRVELTLTPDNTSQSITIAAGTNPAAPEFGSLDPSTPATSTAIELTNGETYFVGINGALSNTAALGYTLSVERIEPPSCAADNNNAPNIASVLTAPDLEAGPSPYSESTSSCLDEDDWYQIQIPADSQLLATVTYDPSVTDLGMFLFDDSVASISTETAGSALPTAGELARSTVDSRRFQQIRQTFSGDAYLVVRNQGSWNLETYELSLEVIPTTCTSDPSNDSFGTAEVITGIERVEPLSLCNAGEEDWYKINLSPGDTLELAAYYQRPEGGSSDGNIDLELYHPALPNSPIASANHDGTGILTITQAIAGESDTEYRIRVRANAATDYYNLDIQITQ